MYTVSFAYLTISIVQKFNHDHHYNEVAVGPTIRLTATRCLELSLSYAISYMVDDC